MTTIGELVRLDEKAEFRSDVQLDAYEDYELNLGLLRSYIFTAYAPEGYRPSLFLLTDLVNAFLDPRQENRMVTIANFGHGKSHTALAIANFFAKDRGSPEIVTLIEKINQVATNPAGPARLKAFKENKGRYLVIRLRGDVHASLRDQFFKNLDKTLQEHPETKDAQLPFWFREAEKFLKSLEGDRLDKADRFLEQYSKDVPTLIDDVRNRKTQVYDQCVKLHTHINTTFTNFGGEVGLNETIDWTIKEFCGNGKPFGGLLILFDEFSAYILEYARRGASTELQDLLNGIDKNRGLASFMAFAQFAPVITARNAISEGTALDSIIRELTRIPKEIYLASVMESVIDAYLKQDTLIWNQIVQTRSIVNQVNNATYTTYDVFAKRYRDTLEWKTGRFSEAVTKGCFPLHPMTTALLCNLRFQSATSGTSPRTVLGFVMSQVDNKKDQAVVENDQLNWVYPIELVEFFQEQISKDKYLQYAGAYERAGGTVAPEEAKKVIKALLLEVVADLPVRTWDEQLSLLVQMTGLVEADVKGAVQYLVDRGAIRKDAISRRISFYSQSSSVNVIENILANKLIHIKLSSSDFEVLNKEFTHIEPAINWAKPTDWQVEHFFIRAEDFKEEKIQELAYYTEASSRSLRVGTRGCLIICLAQKEDELRYLEENATRIIDQALPEASPLPVLVLLPKLISPELYEALRKKKALASFSQQERSQGMDVFTDFLSQADTDISNALKELQFDRVSFSLQKPFASYRVSLKYTHGVMGVSNSSPSTMITNLYKTAYKLSPPGFVTSYTAAKMKEAVRLLCRSLIQNNLNSSLPTISGIPVANSIVENVLKPVWQLINPAYKVQEPKDGRIKAAWDYLNHCFPSEKKNVEVGPSLATLFNPPYGYDYYTLSLLFSAWIGYNGRYLRFTENSQYASIADFLELLNKDPKDFIDAFCSTERSKVIRISRTEPIETVQKIKALGSRIEKGEPLFTIQEATIAIKQLNEFLDDEQMSAEDKERYQPARDELLTAKGYAESYLEKSEAVLKAIQKEVSPRTLISYRETINSLPRCSLVIPEGKPVEELQSLLNERIERMVNDSCRRYEQLNEITQYGLYYQQLQFLKDTLGSAGLMQLLNRVELGITELANRKAILEKLQAEANVQSLISSLDTSARLTMLHEHLKKLDDLNGYSDRLMALRDSKREAIQKKIEEIEAKVREITQTVGHVSTVKDADNLWRSWSMYSDKVKDSPLELEMNTSGKQLEEVRSMLVALSTVPYTSLRSINDFDQVNRQLKEITARYRDSITEGIQTALSEIKKRIEEQYKKQVTESLTLLSRYEQDIRAGRQLYTLLQQIEQPPAFLPKEKQVDWEDLKVQARAKLDADAARTILEMFKTITSPQKRAELLQDLHSVMNVEVEGGK